MAVASIFNGIPNHTPLVVKVIVGLICVALIWCMVKMEKSN
jgi:hypothetical protein